MCTRAVGALAHFLEDEGLPTTQISLIRLHTERIRPPRALWVSFELGRPLGVPNDAAFQKRVLLAALKLLEAPAGPVLQDFPDDVPASTGDITVLACPVGFAQQDVDLSQTQQLCAAFKREMASLRPWYDMAVARHARTTVGASGIDLDALGDYLCSFLEGTGPETPDTGLSPAYTLKLASDDLKAYYFEGIAAQPGQEAASGDTLTKWFWEETVAGDLLLAVRRVCGDSEDGLLKVVARALIVPASVAGRRA